MAAARPAYASAGDRHFKASWLVEHRIPPQCQMLGKDTAVEVDREAEHVLIRLDGLKCDDTTPKRKRQH